MLTESWSFLRQGEDVTSTLEFAQTLSAPGASAERLFTTFRDQNVVDGSLTAVPYGGYSSSSSIALDLNAGRDRYDRIARHDTNGATSQSRPILPSFDVLVASVEGLSSPSAQKRPRVRRSPSAPNLPHAQAIRSEYTASTPIWRCDDRLDSATARDWGVMYVDDAGFRNIISSYLIWDHQAGRVFDEDDFLDGLIHKPSNSCSKCLVHAVLANGALNYRHVDPNVAAVVHNSAWSEAERLWNADIDRIDSIANAAAGMLIWALHSYNGTDKLGLPFLLQARNIGADMGLYDKRLVSQTYDPSHPRRSRARAIFAWGIYNWAVMAEFAFRSNLGSTDPPPIEPPPTVQDYCADQWMPWPWPRTGKTVPALIDEITVARAGLSCIVKDIVPHLKQHSPDTPLTLPHLEATLELYQRLCDWWHSVNPDLKDPVTSNGVPPHVFMVSLTYNFAIIELFRPFTSTPTYPSPHSKPLKLAKLPVEPATSAAIAAARRQRNLIQNIASLYGRDQVLGFFPYFALPTAYETLPSASSITLDFTPDSGSAFMAALQILAHASDQCPVVRYATLGIQQAASTMQIALPGDTERIFADLKRDVTVNRDRDRNKSDWIVVFNTANTDLQKSRLDNLIKELDKLGIGE